MAKEKRRLRAVHVALPEDVHRKLKIKAAQRNISMQALVVELVAAAVQDVVAEAPPPPAPREAAAKRGAQARPVPITLEEDWTRTKPAGFTFRGRPHPHLNRWVWIYRELCKELAAADPPRFQDLPNSPAFVVGRRQPLFARDPSKLRRAVDTGTGVYAEGNLSARQIRSTIRRLLGEFRIDPQDLQLYLREERSQA